MSIAVLCMPRTESRGARAAFLAAFAVLAAAPDVRVLTGGRLAYDVSHSAFVNLICIAVVVAVLPRWKGARRRIGGWRVTACGAGAWLSHLLLDSFYNHGNGVVVGWPFGRAKLNFPIPWFRSLVDGTALDLRTLRVFSIEIVFYGALLGICVLIRRLAVRRGTAPSNTGH